MSSKREFKVLLVGDASVGKTAFLKKIVTGVFESKYNSLSSSLTLDTLGAEVMPVTFFTSMGEISVKVWDTAGNEKLGGLGEGY